MKRLIVFLLVFTLIFSSIASAAPGDYIHTGIKKIYRADNTKELIDDISNYSGDDLDEFLKKFYKEVDGGKFVNVKEEEKAQLDYLAELIRNNGFTSPEALVEYMNNPINKTDIDTKFAQIASDIAKTFDGITDTNKGKLEDYLGSSEALRLKTSTNYSTPVPGDEDYSTKIMTLSRPNNIGATKWMYKIDGKDSYFKLNDVLDGQSYSAKQSIKVQEGQYFLLCATDKDNKVKAYVSIKITADMIKKPRVPATADSTITATFTPSTAKSGATVASGLPEGSWKMAVLDKSIDLVYRDSKFDGSMDYVANMDIVLASDEELDKLDDSFKKYILVYSVEDNEIEKYKVFEVSKGHLSEYLYAKDISESIILGKGKVSGTTKIEEFKLPHGTTKVRYALVKDDTIKPKLDRVYADGIAYEFGEDIDVESNDFLMVLATDNDGKVKAYKIIPVKDIMIKEPPVDKMIESINYTMPVKSDTIGSTKFVHLGYTSVDGAELYYKVSDKEIPVPEKGKGIPSGAKKITDKNAVEIFPSDASELRDEKGFTKYMMVYAVKDDIVIAATHDNFVMIPSNVGLPPATDLPWANYNDSADGQPLKPGNSPNSTILKKLDKYDISSEVPLKYVYTFVNENKAPGINEIIKSTKPLEAGQEILSANVKQWLQILLVDGSNRTKYYANVELTADNIRVSNAYRLTRDNYSEPEAGTEFGSTKFRLLGFKNVNGASQFMVAISDKPFITAPELNKEIKEALKYATIDGDGKIIYDVNAGKTDNTGNILGVDTKTNKYLLLIATDGSGLVKGYQTFTLTENNIRGKEAYNLTSANYTLGKGSKPGTVRFTMLSPFNVGNTSWRYIWSKDDIFSSNPPFDGQVMDIAKIINTKSIDKYSYEAIDDIMVGADPDFGHILLLATNSTKVIGYKVIPVTANDVQKSADTLDITFVQGSKPDSTKISGTDAFKANKYIISKTAFTENPGPNTDLPKTGVKDVPGDKEISIRIGEHLRVFYVDANNKIQGFKDIEIKDTNIKQGTATLKLLKADNTVDNSPILEGKIKTSAIRMKIELTNATWADVINDRVIRDAFLSGFKADGNEQGEWNKVIQKIRDGRFSIAKSGNDLILTTSVVEDYNISAEQKIKLTIPPQAIVGAINPIEAGGEIVIMPTIDANISGTIVNNIRQSEINSGKATIVIDIVDSKWIDGILTTDNRKALLNGFEGLNIWGDDTTGLKSIINSDNNSIKLSNPQRITITIPENTVVINSPETIKLTIPRALVDMTDSNDSDIIASPSFTIYPNIVSIEGTVDPVKKVLLEAPNYVNALKDNDTWSVELNGNITFKDGFSPTNDIVISSLPAGLKLEIAKEENSNKKLSIKLVGKSSKELINGSIVLVIKSSAINEKNYTDSKTIALPYNQGDKIELKDVTYEIIKDDAIKEDGIYLKINDTSIKVSDLQYSLNATNGTSGTWVDIPNDLKINENLEPITISVKETKQPNNFRPIGKLINPAAPTGISIVKYNYDTSEVTLDIGSNVFSDLEYNLGIPNKWDNMPDTKIVILNKDVALTVRKKAFPGTGEDGKLPSLPTPKLNGLFLGGVSLDVSQSKIIGATKDMKYRLSDNGTWNLISVNDPTVEFKFGNEVWVSEAKNEKNARKLGVVDQTTMTTDDIIAVKTILDNGDGVNGIYYHIRDKVLMNKSEINLQYNITKGEVPTGTWFNLGKGSTVNNVAFVPGNVFVRKVDDPNSLPSNPIKIIEIADSINPPKIMTDLDNKTLLYESSDGYEPLDKDFEYKINTGDYLDGDLLATDPKRLGNVTVYVKKKATQKLLESKEISFTFTENISLANVKVNVAKEVIEGTTAKMEYKTSNDSWKPASSKETPINMYEGMSIWIREAGKPSTERPLLEDLKKMDEPKELEDPVDPNTKHPPLIFDVTNKFIKNNYGFILEYRLNDGDWNTIAIAQTLSLSFVPSKLSIRTKATTDKLPSDEFYIVYDIAYPDTAPKVDSDDIGNKIKSIDNNDSSKDWKDYEFKLKTHTEWMPGEGLKTYDLSGNKVVQIRKKGSATIMPSEVTEVTFTRNIDITKVALRTSEPLNLLYTEPEMEYQVYLVGKPVPTTWTKASAGTTTLDSSIKSDDIKLIIIRDSRKTDDLKILVGNEVILYEDINKVTVNAEKQLLMNTTNSMEYSLDSTDGKNGTWLPTTLGENKVSLKIGDNIWVRERNSRTIFRKIEVGQELKPYLVFNNNIDGNLFYDITNKKIAHFTKQKLEYRIGEGQWKAITKDLGNNQMADLDVEFRVGDLEFRTVGDGNNFPSESIIVHKFTEPEAPEVRSNRKSIEYKDGASWKPIDVNLWYRVGANGEWKSGDKFVLDPLVNGNTMIFFRKVATRNDLHSQPTSLTLIFANLELNVTGGRIDGVSTKMEYSLNSTDGIDGNWIGVTSNNGYVDLSFVEGMSIWFREQGNTSMKVKLVEKIQREVKPVLTDEPYKNNLHYSIAKGKIANYTKENLEFKAKVDGKDKWIAVNASSDVYEVNFEPGPLEFRKAGTATTLPSHPNTLAVIKAQISKPIVMYDDVINMVTSINGKNDSDLVDGLKAWSLYEYRINSTSITWISGEFLATEDLSGDKTVHIRIKATRTELASQEEKEIKFTKNLELEVVTLSKHAIPLVLNGTTKEMQYRINGGGEWKTCSQDSNTTILIGADGSPLTDLSLVTIIEICDDRPNQQSKIVKVYQKP